MISTFILLLMAIGIAGISAAIGGKISKHFEQREIARLKVNEREAEKLEAMLRLSDSLEKLHDSNPSEAIAQMALLITGMEAMCKELCRTNDAFIKAVETFQRSIDGSSLKIGDGEEDEDTEAEQEVRTLVRKGVSQVEAEARVRERLMYSKMGR